MQNTLPSVLRRPTSQHPTGWLRLDELPIRKTLARQLIKCGALESVLAGMPGCKRGVRLVSETSFQNWLATLPRTLPRAGGLDGGGPNLGRKKKKISVANKGL
jgi:hypothetical protein